MDEIKELRKKAKVTQQQAADLVGISLRSFKDYENDSAKKDTLKYKCIVQELSKYTLVDETHGVLSLEDIKEVCKEVMDSYNVHYCYLFGSYAKGTATGSSDIDLLISTETTGLAYFGCIENLRETLHKKIDLLELKQLEKNLPLIDEILKYGIKIYG